jgi:hypothetical protein
VQRLRLAPFREFDDKKKESLMASKLGSDETSTFTISMNYDGQKVSPRHLGAGAFGLASKDSAGHWVNAVNLNFGGSKSFVVGSWKPGMSLGTYGVDPSSKTAWAVVNHAGDFAVSNDIELVPGQAKK